MDDITEYYDNFNLISLPLVSKQKYPYIKEWQKLKKSKKIGQNDNIGILTGKVNNIIVIDIDDINLSWESNYGGLIKDLLNASNQNFKTLTGDSLLEKYNYLSL